VKRELPTKIAYFAPSDIQVARVDRQCIVSFCSALATLGVAVELVAIGIRTSPHEVSAEDPLSVYRIPTAFRTRILRVPVRQGSSQGWIALNRLAAHVVAGMQLLAGTPRRQRLVLYTKTYSTGCLLLAMRGLRARSTRVIFEAHLPPSNAVQRFVLRHADRVIANTHALAADLVSEGAAAAARVLGTHQGVDLDLTASDGNASGRQRLAPGKRLVVYTGKLYVGYEEVESLLAAARRLEDRGDVEFVLAGGRADHVAWFRDRIQRERRGNVRFVGFVPPREVHELQSAADILVLYYPSGLRLNAYRSPGKLFEYMAARRPIVAVDLPVLREVLGEEPAALVVPPDDPDALADAIGRLLDDPDLGASLASAAAQRVRRFTWEERARAVLRSLQAPEADAQVRGVMDAPRASAIPVRTGRFA
jgi:glycosyltransferase involved in cell wall biosynthesis